MPRLSAPVAVLASAALLATVAAGSYAAGTVITSKQIKDGTIKVADLSPRTVKKLRGQQGPAGPAGPAGANGAPGAAGTPGQRGASAWEPVPSGTTISGGWYIDVQASGIADYGTQVALSGAASALLIFGTNAFFAPSTYVQSGESSVCTGTSMAPTAPPGTLCVYVEFASNANVDAYGASASRQGFQLRLSSLAAGDAFAYGSWAYQGS